MQVELIFGFFYQSEISCFSRIGYVCKNSIFQVIINSLGYTRIEQFAQCLALAVNILVAPSREVNAFKRTSFAHSRSKNFFEGYFAIFLDNNSVTRR